MPSPLSFRRLALALLAGAALGCSEASPNAAPPLDAALGCGAATGFAVCDIVEVACQQRIAEVAACQWAGPGRSVPRPLVRTLSQEEYRAELAESAELHGPASALRAAVDASLALFGLIADGDLSAEAVAARNAQGVLAYYDPQDQSITVIDHGSGADPAQANATLLHEMIHALQDAAYGLDALRTGPVSDSSDAELALRCLVEGEAKLHDLLFSAALGSQPLTPQLLQEQLQQRRSRAEDVLFESSSVLASSLQSVPYLYGPEWLLERWLDGGREALGALYTDVPAALLAVLESSWEAPGPTEPPSPYPAPNVYSAGPEPQAGSELIPLAYDRLGAYTVYAAARQAGGALEAQALALGWRGDQLDVYELDTGGAAARWHVGFDDAQQAAAFASLLQQNPSVSVRQQGPSVVGVVSEAGEKPEWLFGPAAR